MSAQQKELLLWGGIGAAVVVIFIWLMTRAAANGGGALAQYPSLDIPPPYQPGALPPAYVFNPETVNLDGGNYSPGSCGCGCEQLDPGLTATFNSLTQSFAASLTATQEAFTTGLLASIPSWVSSYYNNDNGLAMYNSSLSALNAA